VQQGMKRALEDLDMILKLLNSSLIRPRILQGTSISSLARFIGHSHSPLLQVRPGSKARMCLLCEVARVVGGVCGALVMCAAVLSQL